jgi:hypothetical protein
MRFALVILLALPCLAHAVTFNIADASPHYTARIVVGTCDKTSCSGPAKVTLFDRATAKPVQTFETPDMRILLDEKSRPAVNNTALYSDESALVIGDFNFDGTEDIAIRNGNNSGYDGPSYDVYVNAGRRGFVPAADLTDLASSKLGMFQVDAKRKRLITLEKDGCCWHLTTEYAVVPGRGLVSVHTLEEKVTPDDRVAVTTSDLVAGKWQRKTQHFKVSEYYKN